MLMVIFGAGASYDSVSSRPPKHYPPVQLPSRPPLANELFDDRPNFRQAMQRFEECKAIIPYLQSRPPNVSVEERLESLQAEADDFPRRHQQLAAIRYYLHFMLWECEQEWKGLAGGITNYRTLLDRLERWRKPGEQICLVTFNYDTLLEEALSEVGIKIRDVSDYIAYEDYKVIKLHGSVNWGREVDTSTKHQPTTINELINRAADLKLSESYRLVTNHPMLREGGKTLFPALAIPVQHKGGYECPTAHLDCLRDCIPQVTKLLVVGWRAQEANFCQLLASKVQRDLKVLTVSGSVKGANEINSRLEEVGLHGDFFVAKGGFTEFVVNREAEEFLSS